MIGTMLVAMLIDLAVGWLDPRARYTVTSLALGSVAIAACSGVRCRSFAGEPLTAARDVDQVVPQLEERWSVTELAQNNDARCARLASDDKVGTEAESRFWQHSVCCLGKTSPLPAVGFWVRLPRWYC